MNESHYTQDYIAQYLQSHADLDMFYVYCPSEDGSGLIHYFDDEGESWSLMEEDDELVLACIEFLRNRGNQLFVNIDQVKEFEANKLK